MKQIDKQWECRKAIYKQDQKQGMRTVWQGSAKTHKIILDILGK